MKSYIIVLFLLFSCNQSNKELTTLSFNETLSEIGILKREIMHNGYFLISNTGNNLLNIKSVEPDCHCTISNFPKYPIKPNTTDTIHFTYSPSNLGYFQQKIIVKTNTLTSPTLLIIRGKVEE